MTDSPPAYSSEIPSPRGASTHLPPPTVDQVHIFSRHDDIKGTLTTISSFCHLLIQASLCRNILHRPKCPSSSSSSEMQAKIAANAPCLFPDP